MQWVAGQITDRLGRRRVLLCAMVLRSLNLALLGWAIGARASFATIGALCIVNGAMRAFYDPAASALVAALCARDKRVAAFSLHRVGSSLGWAAGPLAITFAPEAAYSTIFYVAAPITLIAAGAVALLPETGTDPAPARACAGRSWPSSAGTASSCASCWRRCRFSSCRRRCTTCSRSTRPSTWASTGPRSARCSWSTASWSCWSSCRRWRCIRRVGTAGALVLGSLGYVVAYFGVGLATGYLTLLVCVVLATLCEIAAVPAHQARVTALAPIDNVAGYVGLGGLVQGIAQTSGPIVGSCLIELTSPQRRLDPAGAARAWRPRPASAGGRSAA